MSKALETILERRFQWAIGVCCLVYLCVEVAYVARLPLVMDEFQGAAAVHRLFSEVPYVDFKPYKTVLGYYLQLPVMALSRDPWQQIMLVKLGLAVATAVSIFFAATVLKRHLGPVPVVLATAMLVSMSTFLERSAELRVDMLTSLFGLFGLLALLDRQILRAGILAGVSFLTSQKGVYFILCGGFALGIHWLLRERTRRAFGECLRFTASALSMIAIYFAFWALLSSASTVSHEVFVKNQSIAFEQMYELRHYWFQTLGRNPLFWSLYVLSLGQLLALRHEWEAPRRDGMLLAYGGSLLALGLWHKQPWPYFFVLLIPTAWVLIASFYHAERRRSGGLTVASISILGILGIGYPLTRLPTVLERDNSFQHATVTLANDLLEDGDTYLAGVAMVHTRPQPPGPLGWLDARRLHEISQQDPRDLIALLDASRLKLIITNYRIRRLPSALLDHLAESYSPYVGNILLYAPIIRAGESRREVPFAGDYEIVGPSDAVVEIDGLSLQPQRRVRLDEGIHDFTASVDVRLRWIPEGIVLPEDSTLLGRGVLFGDVYGY